jgi:hypothetical protein
MARVLWLLGIQGVLGAFDTIYYHEWKARLTARGPGTYPELRLHATRDFVYAALFCSLPRLAFQGVWAAVLSGLLAAEIVITLKDFVVEDRTRRSLGGVYAGERVTHAVMGIIYGAMLASLIPALIDWWARPTSITRLTPAAPRTLCWVLTLMGIGVFISGLRDLSAVLGIANSDWPWRGERPPQVEVR